ncbi:lipopolysaccharide biosynthesis protein [Caulobacter sp. 17J80-11]|uniref:lipopolysaccharide biosynthesis protein n=1 Tax=Caulobacter sp. 17J80-11 TaxID=2763502 RepID=UPI00351C4BBD
MRAMFWRGVWGYLPANAVQGLVGLGSIVVFTRLLTPEEYGRYALAFSVLVLAHTSVFTWLEAAMARFWAAERDEGLSAHFATLYRTFFALTVPFALVAGLALWLWPAAPALKGAVAAALGTVIAKCLVQLARERRRAAGEVASASLLDMAQTAGGFLLGAGLAAAGLGARGPLLGLLLGALLLVPFCLPRELSFAKGGGFEPARARAYAAYGLPVSASLILALGLASLDRFLIAGFLDAGAVGAYHAAYTLANRTLDVLFVWLGAAGGPALVAALERGGRTELEKTAREQASTMLLLCLPAAAGLALVARPLAELLVGEGLRAAAAQVTPWAALSALFAGLTTYYFHQAFTLGRRTTLLLAAMAVPAAANLALNLILLPRFGLAGAAWAAAASYAIGAVASYVIGRKATRLPLPWNTLLRCAFATAAMAVVVVLLPELGGLPELILKAGAGVIVYGACAWALDAGGVREAAARTLFPRFNAFLSGRPA